MVFRHHAIVFRFIRFDALEHTHQQVVERRHWLRIKAGLRDRPAINLPIEHRQCSEEETDHQDEAQNQAEPGMQPGHALASAIELHAQPP